MKSGEVGGMGEVGGKSGEAGGSWWYFSAFGERWRKMGQRRTRWDNCFCRS